MGQRQRADLGVFWRTIPFTSKCTQTRGLNARNSGVPAGPWTCTRCPHHTNPRPSCSLACTLAPLDSVSCVTCARICSARTYASAPACDVLCIRIYPRLMIHGSAGKSKLSPGCLRVSRGCWSTFLWAVLYIIHDQAKHQRLNANTLYVAAILFSRSTLHRESLPCLPNNITHTCMLVRNKMISNEIKRM